MYIKDEYEVIYGDKTVGYYYVYSDDTVSYSTAWGSPWDIEEQLKALKLDKEKKRKKPLKQFSDIICEEYRIPGTRKRIYQKDMIRLERYSRETDERYYVYKRSAEEGDPEYSPLKHDAPHNEGPHTPEGMREWPAGMPL